MFNKQHASTEKLRSAFYGNDNVLEAAIDKISEFRGEVVDKIGFAPIFVIQQKTEHFMPRYDLFEMEDAYHLDIELPGLAADDICVIVTRDSIVITGKRSKRENEGEILFLEQLDGCFSRTLNLSGHIDGAQCKAVLTRGLLHVTLPKLATKHNEPDDCTVLVEER